MRIAFYETDAMGVVHHANYIRFFENARVEWMRSSGLLNLHHPEGPFVFAVYEQNARYLKTLRFDDEIDIRLQVKLDRARVNFQYAMYCERQGGLCATGSTVLVPVDTALKPARLPVHARDVFAASPWDDTWPL